MSRKVKCDDFEVMLRGCGLTKVDLAELLGLNVDTIYRWDGLVPVYAVSYLRMRVERDGLRGPARLWVRGLVDA